MLPFVSETVLQYVPETAVVYLLGVYILLLFLPVVLIAWFLGRIQGRIIHRGRALDWLELEDRIFAVRMIFPFPNYGPTLLILLREGQYKDYKNQIFVMLDSKTSRQLPLTWEKLRFCKVEGTPPRLAFYGHHPDNKEAPLHFAAVG